MALLLFLFESEYALLFILYATAKLASQQGLTYSPVSTAHVTIGALKLYVCGIILSFMCLLELKLRASFFHAKRFSHQDESLSQ